MKLRKVMAALAAAAVASSAMAISAFATFDPEGHIVCLISNDSNVPVLEDKAVAAEVYGFKATINVDNYRDYESALNEGTVWFGGGVGQNAKSTEWTQLAKWGVPGNSEDVFMEPTDTRGVYTITYLQDKPCFTANEEYAFFWLQDWSGDKSFTYKVAEVVLLNKDGNNVLDKASATTPTEPATPAEPTEEVTTPDEPTAEPEETIEETAEPEETEEIEETVEPAGETEEAAEPDWDSYDVDAAAAANEDFVLFGGTMVDLYSVLGDDLYDLATIDATFKWTAGEGWCGGSGLSGIVAESGDAWIGGPEYGAANANEGVVDDGVATQTILDITTNPIAQLGVVEADGSTTYPQLDLQNWWNGTEAGAELVALTFYAADGTALGELTWGDAATNAPSTSTTTPANNSSDSKGSPDTGVAGVAAAAGVAALAGVAVVAARKRK